MATAPTPRINRIGIPILDYRGGKSTLCAGCGHNAISERIIDAMKASVSANQLENYYSLAGEFHEVLVGGCGNSILVRQYDQIKRQLRRYQAAMSGLPESAEKSIVEHGAIVKAIRAGNGVVAAQAARAHIEDLIQRFRKAGESG